MNLIKNVTLTIYALSDIYNLLSYARVKTFIESNNPNPNLTIVSGDFISPSKYTNIDGGKTIMDVFDLVPIDIASFGNHEFDIDPVKLNSSLNLNLKTTFISTNIKYIANTLDYWIYHDELTDLKLGFVGLCGNDFYQKYPIQFVTDIKINQTLNYIKDVHKPDYLIGLTHMDLKSDLDLIDLFPQIDLILGGHIHSYDYSKYKGVPIIRTGENAESIGQIDFYSDKSYEINLIDISNLIPHKSIRQIYLDAENKLNQFNNVILFNLNLSYSTINVRTKPESFPKLICSLITKYSNSDITILNAGIFRKTTIFNSNITFGDLKSILPFEDTVVRIQMDLKDLVDGIEYANTKYKGQGGYIQSDNSIDWIKNTYWQNKFINVTTTKLLLKGVDPNPYFTKYSTSFSDLDGIPIQDIIISYQGMTF